ncbi:MAG: hypothetical protein D6705_04845 [Deltaproteobacteria bacterium]|nr:MAG: hypothetical protein D6705_04845 [Deltaproteobacteria bacterium]
MWLCGGTIAVAMAAGAPPAMAVSPDGRVPVQRPEKLDRPADARETVEARPMDDAPPPAMSDGDGQPQASEEAPRGETEAQSSHAASTGASAREDAPPAAEGAPPSSVPPASPGARSRAEASPAPAVPPLPSRAVDDERAPGLDPLRDASPRKGPSRRGTALMVTGIVMGGAGLLARDLVFVFDLVGMRRAARRPPTDVETEIDYFWITPYIVAPAQLLSALPASLVATGAFRRGRWRAWYAPEEGAPNVNRLRKRASFGWTLLGLGYGLYLVDMIVLLAPTPQLADSDFGLYLTHIGLSLAGTAAITTGLAIGPHAAGRLRGHAERGRVAWTVTAAPVRAGGGLQIAGRF